MWLKDIKTSEYIKIHTTEHRHIFCLRSDWNDWNERHATSMTTFLKWQHPDSDATDCWREEGELRLEPRKHPDVKLPKLRRDSEGLALTLISMGCSCSTAVEYLPCNQKVGGSIPAGCRFFPSSFPTFLHQWSVLNQIPQGGASLTVCCDNN